MENKTFWDACSELSSALFKTYAVIHRLCDNDIGYCFAKNKIIADRMNKHEISVSRDISELISKEFLYSLEIKRGYVVLERRLYTVEQHKLYLEDLNNLEKLMVTSYKEAEGITLFTNERYLNGVKRTTIIKNVNGSDTVNKNANGTVNKIVNGTVNKNAKSNLSNINLSNITTTSSSEIKILLEQHGISPSTKINILNLVKEKNISFERIVEVLKIAPVKKWQEGAIYRALENNWDLQFDEEQEEKRKADERAEREYQKSLEESKKLNEHKARVMKEQKEKDELQMFFEALPESKKEKIRSEAYKIAIEKYGKLTGDVMARTVVIYELLRELKE